MTETNFETPFYWTCPYCGRDATITSISEVKAAIGGGASALSDEPTAFYISCTTVRCPSPECRGIQLTVQLYKHTQDGYGNSRPGDFLREWTLIPASAAKAYPNYIPLQIRADYEEACLVLQPSPKASATLSRRCLQGMIRDYWGITKGNLKAAIDALEEKVEPDVWQAIESVRKLGNIGAHMEQDVNLIMDIEPEEAGLLIWLIQHLMKQWYINREERKARLAELAALSALKDEARRPAGEASAKE